MWKRGVAVHWASPKFCPRLWRDSFRKPTSFCKLRRSKIYYNWVKIAIGKHETIIWLLFVTMKQFKGSLHASTSTATHPQRHLAFHSVKNSFQTRRRLVMANADPDLAEPLLLKIWYEFYFSCQRFQCVVMSRSCRLSRNFCSVTLSSCKLFLIVCKES